VRPAASASTHDKTPRVRKPSAVRREEIINAAAHLWATYGYHATSVDDVGRAAGHGKGALKHHIESKEEDLIEIHNRFVDPMVEFGRDLLQSEMSSSEALRELSRELMRTIVLYRDHVAVFFGEMRALSPARFEAVRQKRREFEQIVEEVIARGIESREFGDLPPSIVRLAFLGMHNYSYTWIKRDGKLSADEISDSFSEIFLEGIRRK
jgi:AcrR family transcriptional regulator